MSAISPEGWAAVSTGWLNFYDEQKSEVDSACLFVGYIRVLREPDLPMSLVRDSRWAVGIYDTPSAAHPWYVVPGCKVEGIHYLTGQPNKCGALSRPTSRESLDRDARALGLRLVPEAA